MDEKKENKNFFSKRLFLKKKNGGWN